MGGGSPIIPRLVHQPAYPSIWPAAPSPQRGLSPNPGVTMWVQLKRSYHVRENSACHVYALNKLASQEAMSWACFYGIWWKSESSSSQFTTALTAIRDLNYLLLLHNLLTNNSIIMCTIDLYISLFVLNGDGWLLMF